MAADNWLLTNCIHFRVLSSHYDLPVILSVTELSRSLNLTYGFNNIILGRVSVSDSRQRIDCCGILLLRRAKVGAEDDILVVFVWRYF